MGFCKYCGNELPPRRSVYCDDVCERMERYVNGTLTCKVYKKKPDKFDAFIAAQKEAWARGDRSYGFSDFARTLPPTPPLEKHEFLEEADKEKIRSEKIKRLHCEDCANYISSQNGCDGKSHCVAKPNGDSGQVAEYHPKGCWRACKRFFKPLPYGKYYN